MLSTIINPFTLHVNVECVIFFKCKKAATSDDLFVQCAIHCIMVCKIFYSMFLCSLSSDKTDPIGMHIFLSTGRKPQLLNTTPHS